MTDADKFAWVAEHLVLFRPCFSTAYMEWVDDAGFTHYTDFKSDSEFQVSNAELLTGCIEQATTKNEKPNT